MAEGAAIGVGAAGVAGAAGAVGAGVMQMSNRDLGFPKIDSHCGFCMFLIVFAVSDDDEEEEEEESLVLREF